MTTGRDIIAKKLKDYREKYNLNQFEFAEECGISRETLSLIERCRTNLTLDTLDLLAVRMNVTVSDLLSNDTLYFLIETKIEAKGITTIMYGIGAIQEYRLIDYVLGISDDEEKVKELIEKFNQNKIDVKHLEELTNGICVI